MSVCCKLPQSLEIGPDQVNTYLAAIWGLDDKAAGDGTKELLGNDLIRVTDAVAWGKSTNVQ